MSVFFYNIFLVLFNIGIRIASLFDPKAKKWVAGRRDIFQRLTQSIPAEASVIWVHCASLGEFEQGRPLIEALKSKKPDHKILLTFFSPSGYEVQKNYGGADWVFYLPLDGPAHAKRFLEIIHPSLVIFVKYEFWYYYLKKIKYRNIPLLLVSALFRSDMSFFKWYGSLQRKMLSRFDHLFVQNENSKLLMDNIGLASICSVSGDTRFDRVIEIAEKGEPLPLIQAFVGDRQAIVAGSTWPEDEQLLQKALLGINDSSLKWIIAPHETDESHVAQICNLFPNAMRYSSYQGEATGEVLIIDNVGMLSRLYKYGSFAYVGGGLKKLGVHNVLEPAVYGKPVLMGPFYEKYVEARGLVAGGGALIIHNETELLTAINDLRANANSLHSKVGSAAKNFVWENKGATERIMDFIHEKRLLIN